MHRQSLGSPSCKIHSHGAVKQEIAIVDEPSRRRDSCVIASTAAELDDDNKAPKTHRSPSPLHPPPKPESLIHIIPVLTFLCFLVLYLCSHTPSQADLDQFSGFKSLSNYKAAESLDIEDTVGNQVGGSILAIGSLRNLQEIGASNRNTKSMWKSESKFQLNRKFADF